MMAYTAEYLLTALLVAAGSVHAAVVLAPECEAPQDFADPRVKDAEYASGLLWRVSKPGSAPSFLFGTIHVADEAVVTLPASVSEALRTATIFAMEVVPEPGELMMSAGRMYFSDGRKLSDLLSTQLFDEVVRLLSSYHLPRDAVTRIKPWAAFLTMSYPADFGEVLDMQLLARAQAYGARIVGLETLGEQLAIFDTMTVARQLRLLVDTTCHYETVEADFEKMKTLYLARDLAGLYAYGQRYSQADDELYNELINKVLINRNRIMSERMQPLLREGNAFIAIGAMHLAGTQGVLALLARNNYKISLVY